ncbi:MAG: hypothetical protein ABGY11_04005 [Candidatus Thioglobus sp.]|jgi:hypothetical protein
MTDTIDFSVQLITSLVEQTEFDITQFTGASIIQTIINHNTIIKYRVGLYFGYENKKPLTRTIEIDREVFFALPQALDDYLTTISLKVDTDVFTMGRVVGRSTSTSTPTNTNTIITNTIITNTKRKTNKEKISEFIPNETSEQAIRDEYANATKGEVKKLIEDFKDQMLNRTAKWSDIQSCFRNYLRKGYIKINEQKVQSFSQIKKMINSKQKKPLTLDEIKQYTLGDFNVH